MGRFRPIFHRGGLGFLLAVLAATGAACQPGPVRGPGGGADSPPAADTDATPRPDPADLRRVSAEIERRVTAYAQAHDTSYSFGVYIDSGIGRVILETDAPANVTDQLVGADADLVQIRREKVEDY
ncbi:hypothetical protein Franean1_5589 [Parafrankia sp. EAN1pec]|uniref:hypothetical protein n=1 Tax=Parafrankia sp. (strain EAN1pec) TaxID=298653 RepID=UPI00005436D5|nr:hypothetical protein Franean1_5589 [Frankia sp. EAN1pec]